MRMPRSKLLLALSAAVGVTGCGLLFSNGKVGLAPAYATPPRLHLDGSAARIDLLARGFVVDSEKAPGRYAYYCYLVFADRASASLAARRAAAKSYLSLLSDVEDASKSSQPENMAILLAPILKKTDMVRLREHDTQTFLEGYNYDRAQLLVISLKRQGQVLPRVAIVGSRKPLEEIAVAPSNLAIVDLDLKNDDEIQARLLKLQQLLEAGESDIRIRGEPIVLRRLRQVFQLVGSSLGDLASVST
jgi:hypothetical protein